MVQRFVFLRGNLLGAARWSVALWIFLLVLLGRSAWTVAAEKQASIDVPQKQLQKVLQEEGTGLAVDRTQALAKALTKAPELQPIRWQSGYTRWKNKWLKFDELANDAAYQDLLEKYAEARRKAPDTVNGQMNLADWCHKHDLQDQELAHLNRVLVLQPNHSTARARSGWQLVDGRWVHKQELVDARLQAQQFKKALGTYSAQIRKNIAKLSGTDPKDRAEAEKNLLAVDDPAAIPVLAQSLAGSSDEAKFRAIEIFARMTTPMATQALASMAVANAFSSLGESAATALREKPEDQFVPDLLSMLSTPIESRYVLQAGTSGRLVYQHLFARETESQKQLLLVTQNIQSRNGQSDARLAAQLAEQAGDQIGRVADANANTENLNKCVYSALEIATGEKLPPQPDAWWKWWYDRNEVYIASEKPTVTAYQTSDVTVQTQLLPEQRRYECLAAGTQVWTATGLVAIETMKTGDLVLAQNPESGELAYKPVLQTTVRAPGPIVRIETETDAIRSSGGHLFWIAGQGWVRSRLLEPGMRIHDVSGSTQIKNVVNEGGLEPTYNLIVADFHTYFVGDGKVLSHDNSIRKPTSALVPGLIPR